jgi:hypothetical protein
VTGGLSRISWRQDEIESDRTRIQTRISIMCWAELMLLCAHTTRIRYLRQRKRTVLGSSSTHKNSFHAATSERYTIPDHGIVLMLRGRHTVHVYVWIIKSSLPWTYLVLHRVVTMCYVSSYEATSIERPKI